MDANENTRIGHEEDEKQDLDVKKVCLCYKCTEVYLDGENSKCCMTRALHALALEFGILISIRKCPKFKEIN